MIWVKMLQPGQGATVAPAGALLPGRHQPDHLRDLQHLVAAPSAMALKRHGDIWW